MNEILDVAARLLWERPLSKLTVDELMAATSLGRSSFYVHFRDLHDLAGRLLARLEAELWEPAELWTDPDGDPEDSLAAAIRGVVAVWERHGPVLRAICGPWPAGRDELLSDESAAARRPPPLPWSAMWA